MIPLPPILARQETPDSVDLRLHLEAGHRAFAGHFPGHPVLPGVVQLAWAQQLGREAFGLEAAVTRLEQIKFRALIQPDCIVELRLRYDAGRGKLSFEYRDGDRVFSSGRLAPGAEV